MYTCIKQGRNDTHGKCMNEENDRRGKKKTATEKINFDIF